MTPQSVATAILLILGVGTELLCCLGLLMMDDVFDQLHYLGPATALGPLFIAAAVVVDESLSTAGIKALLIATALFASGPVLTHATARAARARRRGDWKAQPEEGIEEI